MVAVLVKEITEVVRVVEDITDVVAFVVKDITKIVVVVV
jgi:hypothetical protein